MYIRKTVKIIVVTATVLLLSACSAKNDRELYRTIHDKAPRFDSLQNTEKAIFHAGTEREVVVLVSYIPKESTEREVFILAGTPKKMIASSILPTLHLDGNSPFAAVSLSVEQLPRELREGIPSWFAVYRVDFPRSTTKKLTLDLTLDGEKKTLFFYKVPKYLVK